MHRMPLPLTAPGTSSRVGTSACTSFYAHYSARCGRRVLVASCNLQQESNPTSYDQSLPSCSGRGSVAMHKYIDSRSANQRHSLLRQQHGLPLEGTQGLLCAAAFGCALASLLWPEAASASEGNLTGGALEIFKAFLDQVENLGPLGVVLFIVTVMLAEMVPLFPTQPLSLASGLLFGGLQGSLFMLLGVTLAAINAYSIAKGIGRPLAERIIRYEMGSEGGEHGVGKKLAEVQATIEKGNFWQQFVAVLLLRLTPVVPFSASNYVLGLTPVQFPAFVGGTLAGMSVWSTIYASLGGASREVLDSGKDLGTLFSELAEQSGSYTKTVAIAGVLLLGIGALFYVTSRDAAQPATSQQEQVEELEVREEVKEKLLQNK